MVREGPRGSLPEMQAPSPSICSVCKETFFLEQQIFRPPANIRAAAVFRPPANIKAAANIRPPADIRPPAQKKFFSTEKGFFWKKRIRSEN